MTGGIHGRNSSTGAEYLWSIGHSLCAGHHELELQGYSRCAASGGDSPFRMYVGTMTYFFMGVGVGQVQPIPRSVSNCRSCNIIVSTVLLSGWEFHNRPISRVLLYEGANPTRASKNHPTSKQEIACACPCRFAFWSLQLFGIYTGCILGGVSRPLCNRIRFRCFLITRLHVLKQLK